MSIFNPELKEFRESNFEANKFSQDTEKRLLKALEDKKERYADIVRCPNKSCGVPVKVEMQGDHVRVSCPACGWGTVLRTHRSMNISIEYSKDRDIENILKATQSKNSTKRTTTQKLYVEKYGEEFNANTVGKFLDWYFIEHDIDIGKEIERIRNDWGKIKDVAIQRLNQIFGIDLKGDLTAYLTTDSRCTYSTDNGYFFVSYTSISNPPNLIILHELLHFYTNQKYYDALKQDGLSDEQYNNIKESMTVLLNVVFKDLLSNATDKGYPQHQVMRDWMRDEYAKNPDLDALIEKAKRYE